MATSIKNHQQDPDQPLKPAGPTHETLDETMHKHLSDPNHHITDQEISNVIPGEVTLLPSASGGEYDPMETKEEALKSIVQEERKGTAWDVLRGNDSGTGSTGH